LTAPSGEPVLDKLPARTAAAGLLLPVCLVVLLSALSRRVVRSNAMALSDAVLLESLALELVLAGTVGFWLWRRGWRPLQSATYPFDRLDLPRGIALWGAAIIAVGAWAFLCRILIPDLLEVAKQVHIMGGAHFSVSLIYSAINAVFEEFLWLGLGFAAFRRYGDLVAGSISAALRVLAHAYQGPLALVTVLPVAVLFTLYYARTRRLWPVIVAHAFQDTLALSLLAKAAGGAHLPG
jgi:uncharacterized protein